jgi:hypothetical protein
VEEFAARRQGIEAAIERLNELATERDLTHDLVRALRTPLHDRLKQVEHRSDGEDGHKRLIELHDELDCILIAAERQRINDLYRDGKLKDEARRRIERELDLREAQFDNLRAEQ